ncbi:MULTISPECIES: DNA-binding response regulator [Rhizobium]|uniref:DNA-binding response regulator n=1 Tax=Rhizobium TaxID=379 RepID=UPI001C91C1DD|nr:MULTISPECIES: DNA-binding response regulator [Rhizobium]MBY3081844.1 response regulator transcription factor [Rhizobium laguerreae]MBY3271389.1 response regulator transcription factor [Rhizobium laguerreae]MBY3294478.1 response regulator transcription factor [Rhizobium laguerreae]MBY3327350.1 response regulator transcription factor [Rhizobium laguerreae]MBY3495654.1 response regulator transcription factor [Rhizobium laguerreae]
MKHLEGAVGVKPEPDGYRKGNADIAPLRKRRLTGELYERDGKVELLIAELAALPRDELIGRAAITKRSDPGYVPSECLVYFIRASRHDNNEAWFERLYRILMERVLRSVPKSESSDGKTESLTRSVVRDKVFSRFVEILSADRASYVDKLDFFEVRFDGAVASFRRDAQEQAWRDENRSKPLEYEEESGELATEVEAAAGVHDPFATSDFDDPIYRSRLDAAIEALPPEQIRIIHMLKEGFPIDSKEPDVMTIAKALGRSEKTIRTYRDKAIAALRLALADGEHQ